MHCYSMKMSNLHIALIQGGFIPQKCQNRYDTILSTLLLYIEFAIMACTLFLVHGTVSNDDRDTACQQKYSSIYHCAYVFLLLL